MGVPSAQKQADILKDKGNTYFKKEKLGAAIEAYTEAITLCPSVPVYWTNRALCERKRNEWEKVEADCRKALQLDSHSVKAYYMLGLALLHYQQYEEAVKQLEKAMDLGRGATTGTYMVEEIWQELSKAKLAEWEAVSDLRARQQLDLKYHLSSLVRDDYQRQLKEAVASIKAATGASGGNQGPKAPQIETEDLIRLDSGSRHDSGINAEKKAEIGVDGTPVQNLPIYTDVELENNLYRTRSESQELDGSRKKGDEEGTAFDPLKQHKLSLRRHRSSSLRRNSSSSVRRQRSQPVSDPDDIVGTAAAAAAGRREESAAPTAAPMTTPEIRSEVPSAEAIWPDELLSGRAPPAADALTVAVQRTASSTSDSEPADPQTIYDVFKVFKEFMKLRQNEEGQKLLKVSEQYQRRSKVLEDVFERVTAPDRPGDVPDHLCCKITMDILRDPVVTSSGVTYERAAILEHLRKVGKFDPFTRAPLTEEQVVPNLAMKEAVQAFLDEHGWAYGPT